MQKKWFESKLVWLNVFLTLSGVMTLVADALSKDANMTVPGMLMLGSGVVGIIIRIWFTDVAITK